MLSTAARATASLVRTPTFAIGAVTFHFPITVSNCVSIHSFSLSDGRMTGWRFIAALLVSSLPPLDAAFKIHIKMGTIRVFIVSSLSFTHSRTFLCNSHGVPPSENIGTSADISTTTFGTSMSALLVSGMPSTLKNFLYLRLRQHASSWDPCLHHWRHRV